MDPRQIPAQSAPNDAEMKSEIASTFGLVDEDEPATCSAAELVRRQRAVVGTRKELLDAVERLTKKSP